MAGSGSPNLLRLTQGGAGNTWAISKIRIHCRMAWLVAGSTKRFSSRIHDLWRTKPLSKETELTQHIITYHKTIIIIPAFFFERGLTVDDLATCYLFQERTTLSLASPNSFIQNPPVSTASGCTSWLVSSSGSFQPRWTELSSESLALRHFFCALVL